MQVLKRGVCGALPAAQMVIGHELPQIARRAGKVGLVATIFSLVITLVVIAIAVGGVWYGLHQAAPHQVPRLRFEKRWALGNLGEIRDRGRTAIDVAAPPRIDNRLRHRIPRLILERCRTPRAGAAVATTLCPIQIP
jgi:hypothetical protein